MSLLEEHDTFIPLNWIGFLGVFNFLNSCYVEIHQRHPAFIYHASVKINNQSHGKALI